MYTPSHFQLHDPGLVLEFMQANTFATLVTTGPDLAPAATHLPFVVEQPDDRIRLTAHLARANPQWRDFAEKEVLVIFQGPHAYISPRWYDKELSVPTWNYVAVHAYGRAVPVTSETAVFEVLEKLMRASEAAYLGQWERLPEGYRTGLAKGLVAFEIIVDRLEAKAKISQNRTEKEIGQVLAGLEQSGLAGDREMAGLMRKLYDKQV